MGEKTEKDYLLDTNVFIYGTNPSVQPSHKKAARRFWRNVLEEASTGAAFLSVPGEVVRELEVQRHFMSEKQNLRISTLLDSILEVRPDIFNVQIEHQLKSISGYLTNRFRDDLKRDFDIDKVKYGGVSDMRIMYTAWQYESILVTANIKDFTLYPFLFPIEEDRLFNLLTGKYVKPSVNLYDRVHEDKTFQFMMNDLHLLIE